MDEDLKAVLREAVDESRTKAEAGEPQAELEGMKWPDCAMEMRVVRPADSPQLCFGPPEDTREALPYDFATLVGVRIKRYYGLRPRVVKCAKCERFWFHDDDQGPEWWMCPTGCNGALVDREHVARTHEHIAEHGDDYGEDF